MAAETSMTMNRAIHAAVRRDYERMAEALRSAPDGDRDRAAQLARAWDHLSQQLTHHHEQEDQYIWPALRGLGVDDVLLAEMESEHGAMHDALVATTEAVHRYRDSGARADADAAAASLEHTQTVTERHLRHEEDELEPQLLRHVESPEWRAVERRLRKQPLPVAGAFFAWLLDGPETEETRYVRSAVPRPVVAILTALFGRQYRRDVAPVWR
jgi:hemerythrin-like domain-containing protein